MDVTFELTVGHLTADGVGQCTERVLRAGIERHFALLVAERGVPGEWLSEPTDCAARSCVVLDLGWDGRGGDEGLARALAACLYDAVFGEAGGGGG
ncbi:hypothetical protein AB0D34_06465 [Streptomyces sp. NPDC048420]|uniref:hypothetical protein n=1 Tax=Streptomyces sp. NPDC048420 TaxID=3155755 RepID=UPI00341C29A7